MRIRLPLTLAIIDGFLVASARPRTWCRWRSVVECMELSAEERAQSRDDWLRQPARRSAAAACACATSSRSPASPQSAKTSWSCSYGGQQGRLGGRRLLGEFQTVIKPLGILFERLSGISGSTILGSGEVALILDVPALLSGRSARNRHASRQACKEVIGSR